MEVRRRNEVIPKLTWTVAETLVRCRHSAAVFTRFRMACAGCVMSPFETVDDVAGVYGLEPELILRELSRACQEP